LFFFVSVTSSFLSGVHLKIAKKTDAHTKKERERGREAEVEVGGG
jgi:hypothetical protein